MRVDLDVFVHRDEDLVQDLRHRATGEGRDLRATHLQGRDHLHGLGDLGRVLDRLDAASNFARIRHGSGCSGFAGGNSAYWKVDLNCSTAALSSFSSGSSKAFLVAML